MQLQISALPQSVADEVRRTRRSPQYGHPAFTETATGHGPCRCCLQPFTAGRDERMLFTWRPDGDDTSLMAPGPVFIHAAPCEAYAGTEFPAGLRGLPLAFEGRASGGIVSGFSANAELRAEQQIAALFALAPTRYVHVRHAQAGCFIARVDRLDVPSVSGRVAA